MNMDETGRPQKNYVGYEYKEVAADSSMASFLLDGYESFGWEMDENLPKYHKADRALNQNKIVLHLKRNRKIINKMELTRLQRNFEACVSEIEALEKSKTSAATYYAVYPVCDTRIFRLDIPLFSVSKDCGKADR